MLMMCGEMYISLCFCPLPGQLHWCLAQSLGGLEVGIATRGPTEFSQNLNFAFTPAPVAGGFHVWISCGDNMES